MLDITQYLGRSWNQLTLGEQRSLAQIFNTSLGDSINESFSEEQRLFLATLFLDVTGKESAIEEISRGKDIRLKPILTTDGRNVVPASVLTDPKNYEAYLSITTSSILLFLSAQEISTGNLHLIQSLEI